MSEKRQRNGWLDEPRNVDRLVHGLWIVCALVLTADLFYVRHPHFGFDGWFAFYPAFGFFAYCLIVLSAKQLRRLVKRDENYYGDGDDLDGEHDAGASGQGRQRDG